MSVALVTKQELAEALNRSGRWIELRVRAGMPTNGFDGRGRRLFDLSACRAWLNQHAADVLATPRKPQSRADVYFIEGAVLIKIGLSTSIEARLESLQAMSPVPLVLLGVIPSAGVKLERWLHDRYEPLRQHGEWFTGAEELRELAAGRRPDILDRYEAGEFPWPI